ncbi:hypothetical protein niasHT_015078 [Heterodera trifolii]|uniref:Uncharacterized protein n=1 Tax=Heterodera trifolii TaxID=157864 RepID=A0ABD2LB10_9BILA
MGFSILLAFCFLLVTIPFVNAKTELSSDGAKHGKAMSLSSRTSLKKTANDDVIKLFVRNVFDHYNMIRATRRQWSITVRSMRLCDCDNTQITDCPKVNSNCDQPARGNGKNAYSKSAKTGQITKK